MATIVNPKVATPPTPINLDLYILRLQTAFANGLPWLDRAFGRAWKMYQDRGDMGKTEGFGRGYAYPGVFSGRAGVKNDYFNVMPNDTLSSYCFFSPRDAAEPVTVLPGEAESYQPQVKNEWRQPVDIIFWFNADKVQPNNTYPITENLLADVRKVLRTVSFFTPSGVYYEPDNIFAPYSMDYVKEVYLGHPFGGFKIEGTIQLLEQDAFGVCPPPGNLIP